MKRFKLVVTNNLLVPCFFLVDCLLLVGLIVIWYFLVFTDSFRQHLPYIACQDVAYYSFPKVDGRVPEIVVYVLAFVMPPVVVLFGEAALSVYSLQGYSSPGADKTVITLGVRMHPIIRRTIRFVGLFLFGCFSTWVLTRTTQLITSQPSPYFFAECAVPGTSCSGSDVVLQLPECDGSADNKARQSFPSLYASLSAYSAVYSGVYITSLLMLRSAKSVRPMLFLFIMTIPYLLGLERIAYFKNSWTDVIAGWILGGVIGAYMAIHILHSFRGSLSPSRLRGYYADNAHYAPELNGNKRFDRDYSYRESQRSMRPQDLERALPAYIGDRTMDSQNFSGQRRSVVYSLFAWSAICGESVKLVSERMKVLCTGNIAFTPDKAGFVKDINLLPGVPTITHYNHHPPRYRQVQPHIVAPQRLADSRT